MAASRNSVGFDRKVELSWLDAAADWAAQDLPATEIRSRLEKVLAGVVAGEGPHSGRGKTMTVLLHVWVLVPKPLVPLRNDALALLRDRTGQERLALHWGMCLATYPFFRSVVETTGRLMALQGTAALSQITRRMAETWGERSTVKRAVQRILRSLVSWEVLEESVERGVFVSTPKLTVPSGDRIGVWLLEASVSSVSGRASALASIVASPPLFPFTLKLTSRDVHDHARLELYRQGLDEEMLTLKSAR